MSRPGEIQRTQYLAERLSAHFGEKYTAEEEDKEFSDTDTYITDPKGVKTPIQNVTSEGPVNRNAAINTRAFAKGIDFEVGEVNHVKWISDVLHSKEDKHYANAAEIILVLHASLPTPDSQYISRLAPVKSSFAGIYYVCIPNSSEDSGYIVALKKYWETPTIF